MNIDKCVQFDLNVQVYEVLGRGDITDEELVATCYSGAEFTTIRQREKRLSRQLSMFGMITEADEDPFGVESKQDKRRRKKRMEDGQMSVLLEQELQYDTQGMDAENLAKVYSANTVESAQIAQFRATEHARTMQQGVIQPGSHDAIIHSDICNIMVDDSAVADCCSGDVGFISIAPDGEKISTWDPNQWVDTTNLESADTDTNDESTTADAGDDAAYDHGGSVDTADRVVEQPATCARLVDPVDVACSNEGFVEESWLEPNLEKQPGAATDTITTNAQEQVKNAPGLRGLLLEQELQYDMQDIDADFLASVYPKYTDAAINTSSIDIHTSMIADDALHEQCMLESDAFHDCSSEMDSFVNNGYFGTSSEADFDLFAEAAQEEEQLPALDADQFISKSDGETVQAVDRARPSEDLHQTVSTELNHQSPWGQWIKKLEPDPMRMRWYGYITV